MRILKEEQHTLGSKSITLVSTNRGAILRNLFYNEIPVTRTIEEPETPPGEKGALFCAPLVFGRIHNRTLNFRSKSYLMPYPDDLNAEQIDPHHLYIHGIHHYYTYEIETVTPNSISYLLDKSRLPKNYPFPHSCRVSYAIENDSDLIISVEVFDTDVATPAALTIHPFFLYSQADGAIIEFKGRLTKRFDYDTNKELPMPESPPTELPDDGPFTEWTPLDTTLDHSFISKDAISEIRWKNALHITMEDQSPRSHYPLQIWTTGGTTRNACGIEHGGPANLFELVHNSHIPEHYLTVIEPGQSKKRIVRYSMRNWIPGTDSRVS